MLFASLLLAAPLLAAPQEPIASWLPPGASVHVEFTAEPFARAGGELALTKIWNEPEFVEFTRSIRPMAEMGIQGAKMQLGAFGLPPNTLELLEQGQFSVTLYDVRVETRTVHYEFDGEDVSFESETTYPDLMFVAENHGEPGLIGELIDALEGMLGMQEDVALERIELEGFEVARLSDASGQLDFEMLVLVQPDRLVLATMRERMVETLQRLAGAEVPSLGANSGFAQGWQRAHRADTVLFAHVDLPALMQMIAKAAHDPDVLEVAKMLPLRSYTYGMGLDGAGMREHFFARTVPGHPLASMVELAPGPLRTLDLAPAGSAVASASRFRFAEMFEAALNTVANLDPNAAREIDGMMAHLDQVGGMSFRGAFLPALGHEIGSFFGFPGRSLLPELGLFVELRDAAVVKTFVDNTVRNLTGSKPRSVRFGKHTIHYVEISDLELGDLEATMRPSWAFLGDHLVVGLWPQTVKNVLAQHDAGGKGVQADPRFASLTRAFQGGIAGSAAVSYVDLQAGFEFLLDNSIPLAQTLAPSIQGVPLDMAALPRTEAIAKHMFGLLGVSRAVEGGTYCEIYSPTGLVLPYALGIGAGLAVFQSRMAMEEAMIYQKELDAEQGAAGEEF